MTKRREVALQEMIATQEDWDHLLSKPMLYVVDAYCTWSGTCLAILGFLKRLKNALGDDVLGFACVDVDKVDSLEKYRGKCEPNFLIYGSGQLVGNIRGCNAPLLETTIKQTLQMEHNVQEGKGERTVIEENYSTRRAVGGSTGGNDEDVSDDYDDDKQSISDYYNKQMTIGVIKPDIVASGQMDEILEKVNSYEIEIIDELECVMTEEEAKELYNEHNGEDYFDGLVTYMTSGPCRVLVMTKGETGEGVVELWRDIIGPFDAAVAKESHPNTLRALYGTDAAVNGIHGSSSEEAAMRELAFFFPDFEVPTYKVVDPTRSDSPAKKAVDETKSQRTLAIIRPDALRHHKERILQKIEELDLVVAMQKEVQLTTEQVEAFYQDHVNEPYFPQLVKQMTCGPVLALCLTHEDAVDRWKGLLGPKDVEQVKEDEDCLRAQFHVDGAEVNLLHGSATAEEAESELAAFFEVDQTLAVIKPEGFDFRDKIIEKFEEAGLMVSHQKSMSVSKEIAEEIYSSKNGAPFYDELITQMTKGPSLMVVLSAEDAVKKLRKCLGPVDPKLARQKQPDSLRAHFGYDILSNSVHAVSTEKDAKDHMDLVFGDATFDWDGYFKPDENSTTVKKITPLRKLAPAQDSESEEEEAAAGDVADDYEDPGPLALLQTTKPSEEENGDADEAGKDDATPADAEETEAREEEKESTENNAA